jgi:hypothetical protein
MIALVVVMLVGRGLGLWKPNAPPETVLALLMIGSFLAFLVKILTHEIGELAKVRWKKTGSK